MGISDQYSVGDADGAVDREPSATAAWITEVECMHS